jgi:hypothetical protein
MTDFNVRKFKKQSTLYRLFIGQWRIREGYFLALSIASSEEMRMPHRLAQPIY